MYTVFTMQGCALCDNVIDLIQTMNYEFHFIPTGHEDENRELERALLASGQSIEIVTLPAIFKDVDGIEKFLSIDEFYADVINDIRVSARTGLVKITFIKADGKECVLEGTLDFNLIPEDKRPKTSTAAVGGSDKPVTTISLYKPASNGWRSVKASSIIEYE